MAGHEPGTVGILPISALGVAFYWHLSRKAGGAGERVVFLSRGAGSGAERWREDSVLAIALPSGRHDLPLDGRLAGTLAEAAAASRMPEMVLVCTNPDQLFDVVSDFVAAVEFEHRAGRLLAGGPRLPALITCANGIYFQRTRRSLIELLEESTLLGRLPDLWPDVMPAVVGRLMRGVTIQTSLRMGGGSTALYRPGPAGKTVLAGGDRAARAAAARRLSALGGWFEDGGELSPTRAEFNKALVNLAINVLGQLAAIDGSGRFRVMTVGEIASPERLGQVRELVESVMHVGRGVGVYRPDESPGDIYEETMRSLAPVAGHVPSSLQWLEERLSAGALVPGLSPTERWLLEPLQHYARSLGDPVAIGYFEGLEARVKAAIGRAVAAQAK